MENSIDSQENAKNKSLKYLSVNESDGDFNYENQDNVLRGSV